MKILINTSNLTSGGGLQVAHSFIYELIKHTENEYFIVLSKKMNEIITVEDFPNNNFTFYNHTIKISFLKIIFGYDSFLDNLLSNSCSDIVFSVFGPTYWRPKIKHVCGYAIPHYVYKNSLYFSKLSSWDKILYKFKKVLILYAFKKQCDILITERFDVTNFLKILFPKKEIYTVTNYYNQIFDFEDKWDYSIKLPEFDGISLLTITANYPHKNLQIIPKVIQYLKEKRDDLKFRFVLTIKQEELNIKDVNILEYIVFLGKIPIYACPYLYKQSTFMFLPTLLECFSASYPEAMKMGKPILTSDLDFAHELCGEAAVYFDPMSSEDIGEKIYLLANSVEKQKKLVAMGKQQLLNFDNCDSRTVKYLDIITQK